jgi:nifR3 family TIM-barrel protein
MSKLIERIHDNPFLLAPMAGITDIAFRRFMAELGTSVVTTELVSANGLQYKSERTRKLMQICAEEKPVGIQIFGETLDALGYAASECEQLGADFVDLNFGCPVNKVVKKGAGSAVLKDLDQLTRILKTVRSAVTVPVTIKVRTGWTHEHRNAPEVCKIAYNEGIEWVAIHGRSRAQAYNGKADWDYISMTKAESPLPVIGNGDLTSASLCVKRLKESNCDAVMIGRGALKNPWIFKESLNLIGKTNTPVERDILPLILRLKELYLEYADERIAMLQIKKFSSWFSSGFPGSAQFRKTLFSTKDQEELWLKIVEYFEGCKEHIQTDTSDESFLMGGHG